MKFIQFKYGNKTMIKIEGANKPCAEFSGDDIGAIALTLFRNGLAHSGNVSLYDADTRLYIVGTMDQLSEGR